MRNQSENIWVWDPFVRAFHWTLVTAYLAAWLSAEELTWLHNQTGYFIIALIGLRFVWGLIGTRYARFSDFVHSPRATMAYLRSLGDGEPRHYLGHNPAGGWMIVALLVSLIATGVSGIMIDSLYADLWEEIHEASANLSLFLVVMHVGGVIGASLLHRENLIKAMLTGKKTRRDAHV